ncbi:unnamed protein product [Rodentolepis nana]|uniref:DUF4206 domain-containing protein n=1 Tax=Rodentolepis nana TaxID=102285 RepID=A0A0R3TAS1_RODNA|nr:unnamed protein product [Rodentolepis nana]
MKLAVSRDSLIALQYMWHRQPFRAPEGWQRWNARAVLVASLRLRVHRLLPTYFQLCQKANELRHKFEETQPTWLIEQPFTYTMAIVEQVLDGSLIESMTDFWIQVEDHVINCVDEITQLEEFMLLSAVKKCNFSTFEQRESMEIVLKERVSADSELNKNPIS